MRRVVTGEQIAQIYNPDPFARPIWRAPVYQTPAGIIALAWLARLLAWIIRMILRHPVAATTAAVLAFAWVSLGWIAAAALVVWAAAGAGDLAVLLAVLVHPVGDRTCAGQVAGLVVLPAPVGRGDERRRPGPLVPGPHPDARARQGHRHEVHRPGTGPAGLRPGRGRFRQAGRQPGPRVRRPAVPHPLGPVRRAGAGVRPPRRARPDHPRPARAAPGRPGGAAGRPPGGRPAVAGPAARDSRPGGRGHRGGQGVPAVGPDPGHAAHDARPDWCGCWPPTPS